MKSTLTRLGILATAFLVLVSCGGDPNIESAKLNLSRRDYVKALESADAAIAMTPSNPLAHYYRGFILMEQGKREPIPNRATYFEQAHSAFSTSEDLYVSQPEQGKEYLLIEVHRTNTWVEEYNASISVLNANPDEELTDVQYDQSIAHLNNAYSIQPDSLNTLEILGEVYLMKGDNDAALATFQRAIASEGEQTAYRYQRIGQLHIQNKAFDDAEVILKTGISMFPASVELVQELADLYIQSNKSSQAIEVLGELVDRDPDNAQYRLVYGIQIYSITQTHADDLRNTYESIEDLNRTIREEERKSRPNRELLAQYRQTLNGFTTDAVAAEAQIEDLTNRAEVQLKRSIELNDTNSFAYNALGTIYYNRGLAQFDKRNATNDNAAATAFDTAGRAFLEQSLPYNERAAELDGENTDYWMFLFRVYTILGMTEKALEAQQKAGL